EIKQLYNENKRLFIGGINQLKKPNFVNSISKPSTRTNLRTEDQYDERQGIYGTYERKQKYNVFKIDIFKMLSVVILLLWAGTLAYFLFFNDKEENIPPIIQQEQKIQKEQPAQKTISVQGLTPKSN